MLQLELTGHPQLHLTQQQLSSLEQGHCQGEWVPLCGLSVPSVAEAVLASGFDAGSFALDVSLPAGVALRQQSLLHWLETQVGAQALSARRQMEPGRVVDPKEALRMSLAAPLAERLGWRHDSVAPDVRLRLMVWRRAPAAEAAVLAECGCGGSSGGGSRKRRRGGRGGGGGGGEGSQQTGSAIQIHLQIMSLSRGHQGHGMLAAMHLF